MCRTQPEYEPALLTTGSTMADTFLDPEILRNVRRHTATERQPDGAAAPCLGTCSARRIAPLTRLPRP